MHGRQHRDRLFRQVDAGKDPGAFGNARKPLVEHGGIKMIEVQIDMVLGLADAAALADFQRHAARDDVARGEILGRRRIALHEALALGIDQIAALAAGALGDQAACAIDSGRVELHELHVLQRQAGAGDHAVAVAGAGVRAGGREIGAAIAAGRQHHRLGRKPVNGAVIKVPGHHAGAAAILFHQQVEREILDEEFGIVLERLAVKRVQDGVTGAVGRRTGALHRWAFAVILHVAAERPLVDAAILGARERHAVMLELIDGLRRFHGQVLHGVDIAEPVRALDRVIHVPLPAVGRHVGERGGDAALGRHGVRPGRKHFRNAGGLEALFGHAQGCAQPGAAGADHDHVIGVIDNRVVASANVDARRHYHKCQPPKPSLSTANSDTAPTAIEKNVLSIRAAILAPSP